MIGALDPVSSQYALDVRSAVMAELGSDLVGFYVYGSAVASGFVPGQSDLDVIVVVRDWISRSSVRRTLDRARTVARPGSVKGLDLWIVPHEQVLSPRPDPRFEGWLLTSINSELLGGQHHPGDARLVLLFQMCRDHAIALSGPPAHEVFGELDRTWVLDAMRVDLQLRGAAGWYRVLNACRTLFFLEHGVLCDKFVGAAWVRNQTEDPWLIDAAIEWRCHGSGPPTPPVAVDSFVQDVLTWIDEVWPASTPSGVPRLEVAPKRAVGADSGLVTCVMVAPTNAELLVLSARCFLEQDWPDRELLVLRPPGSADVSALPVDGSIRSVELRPRDAPAWREVALGEARGGILANWEPLAWYSPDRLTQQVRELRSTAVPEVVVPNMIAFDPITERTRRVADTELATQVSRCARRDVWAVPDQPPRLGERSDIAIMLDPAIAHGFGVPVQDVNAWRRLGHQAKLYRIAMAAAQLNGAARPAVSCLMPTYNRRSFAERAISAFIDQDYPNRELVILDDGEDAIADIVPADESIRYHRLDERATIGTKRQMLCDLADGDLCVQWDDDDWYGTRRLSRQLAPLVAGAADISGILHGYLVDLKTMRFWRGELPLHEGRLHAVIVAGTLAFSADAWRSAGPYPDKSIGEEVALLEAVIKDGGRVASIVNDGIYICVRHFANSWRLHFDELRGPTGWAEVPSPAFLPDADLDLYRSLSAVGNGVP